MNEMKTGTETSNCGKDQAEERSEKVEDRALGGPVGGEQRQKSRRVRRTLVSHGLPSREIELELLEPQRRREEEGQSWAGRKYI